MRPKLFDILGIAIVAAWVALSAAYVWQAETRVADDGPTRSLDADAPLREGETWMTLRRGDDEVGYLHQTRTQLPDGWLLETDMLILLEIFGGKRAIGSSVKATLDAEAYLLEFHATVEAVGREFKVTGDVDGKTITMTVNLGDEPRPRTLELGERPRLSVSAFEQLLAADELEPGDTFREAYFDPTTLGMTEMRLEYLGVEDIDVYGVSARAHHVRQDVAGNRLDAYVDESGEVLIQELPFDVVGARVPAELGRARAAALRRDREELEQARRAKPPAERPEALEMDAAIELLKGAVGGEGAPDPVADDAPADDAPTDDAPTDDAPTDETPAP